MMSSRGMAAKSGSWGLGSGSVRARLCATQDTQGGREAARPPQSCTAIRDGSAHKPGQPSPEAAAVSNPPHQTLWLVLSPAAKDPRTAAPGHGYGFGGTQLSSTDPPLRAQAHPRSGKRTHCRPPRQEIGDGIGHPASAQNNRRLKLSGVQVTGGPAAGAPAAPTPI